MYLVRKDIVRWLGPGLACVFVCMVMMICADAACICFVLYRYKFLLNLDGFSAAYRLGSWLLMNSVVLKEESTKIEYYYRSLRPWEHYIPVFK